LIRFGNSELVPKREILSINKFGPFSKAAVTLTASKLSDGGARSAMTLIALLEPEAVLKKG
jgi:hypothetical protein